MTLYSITTSERASKGQGGNDFLETVYTVGEAKNPITNRGPYIICQNPISNSPTI